MNDAKTCPDKTATDSKLKSKQLRNKSLTNVPLSKLELTCLDGITGGLVRGSCDGTFDPYRWIANDYECVQ